MLSSAALWNCLVQLSACAYLCFCLFPLSREIKEPCNRFICTINKNFPGLKRQKERKGTREKRPLIRWSMRCFYLTSKASRGVQPESWLSLVALSVVEAKHVMCLSSYLNASPAVSNKSSKQFYFLQVWPNMSMAIFPPILCILPSFPRPSQHSFLLVALLCSQWPVVFMWKKVGSFAPVPFVETCVPGISMATHIRGHANPAFRLCGFWHHVFVLILSDVERLWLNHATTNLISGANQVSVHRSSASLAIWITPKERFNHKSARTANNNYEGLLANIVFQWIYTTFYECCCHSWPGIQDLWQGPGKVCSRHVSVPFYFTVI